MNELPQWIKHATIWSLLALTLFLGVQAWQDRQQATRFVVAGGVLEIARAGDGHYHWPGRLDGRPVEFLVDTGATRTAIPQRLAQQLGLQTVGSTRSSTAGGVVTGTVVVGDLELDGGVRVERLRMVALPDLAAPLLGMDVLGRLRWTQDRGRLRVDLHGGGR
ncbi:MAG: clan AA aspartic protease [Rubrivivax sp.]|nr:clan AA aspartic protease [Rubrivivax sp.]